MSTFTSADIGNDSLDVRDIIARVEEMREERDELRAALEEARENEDADEVASAYQALTDWTALESGELDTLEELLSDLAGKGGDERWEGDWYPITLIHERAFEEAMDEMLEDIGELPRNLPSYLRITVDYAALRMDYSEVEVDGHTYLYR